MRYLFLFLILLLASCTPLYFPPVPAKLDLEKTINLNNSQGLSLNGSKLNLTIRINDIDKEGWLAVQWFTPENKEISSDSIWISPELEGQDKDFVLLKELEISEGLWRVVVSFENSLLRQFVIEIAKK